MTTAPRDAPGSAPAAPTSAEEPLPFRRLEPRAGHRAGVCLVTGLAVAAVLVALGLDPIAPLGGWDAAAITFLAWVWIPLRHADAARTARLAAREDTSGPVTDLVLLLAAVASLIGVGDVIALGAARGGPFGPAPAIAVAIGSVVGSWAVVHTVFALRYARMYYLGRAGGVDFNQDEPPRYSDFAYLAFTIGMTFQVSDTALTSSALRRTALVHALLSYLFGAVIIAVTINLIAGLAH